MIKQYFVVGNYIAQIPKDKNISEFILAQLEADLKGTSANSLKTFLDSFFSVIEGEEVEVDMDDED
jgi:hypothetical protein